MHDIIGCGDKYKRIIKIADIWIRKKLGASVDKVEADLQNCGNPVSSHMYNLINATTIHIKETYQRRMVNNYGKLLIWFLYRDTAYSGMFTWMLKQIYDNKALEEIVRERAQEPEFWYANVWHDSKEDTKRLKKEGKISKVGKADSEKIFTPVLQEQKLRRY